MTLPTSALRAGLALMACAGLPGVGAASPAPAPDLGRDIERQVQTALADLPVRLALADTALSFAGRELESERVVKGAPYCATAVHENIQPLADGNRIVRRAQSQLCRDGEGRTRREVQREGGPRIVYLNDPVARQAWVLYPDEKRLVRLRGPVNWEASGAHAAADAAWQASMRDWSERMKEQAARWKEWGARVAEQARSADAERVRARQAAAAARPGEPGIVIQSEVVVPAAPGASAVERRRELRVYRASELPDLPPMPAMAAPPAPPAPPAPVPASAFVAPGTLPSSPSLAACARRSSSSCFLRSTTASIGAGATLLLITLAVGGVLGESNRGWSGFCGWSDAVIWC